MNPLDNNSPFNGPLTPHNFRQNKSQGEEKQTTTRSLRPVRYAPLVIAGLALLVLPLTIWQINTQQDIRQRASEQQAATSTESSLATINGEPITTTDVDLEYTKQQNATAYTVTPSTLKSQILNDVIENKIIQAEAKRLGITVGENDLSYALKILEGLESPFKGNTEVAKDLVLRHKLSGLIANSLIVNAVYSNIDTPQAVSFFETIREQAVENENLIAAATPYATQSRDVNVIENAPLGMDNYLFSPEVSKEIFILKPNEISGVIEDNGKIFIVQVISETLGDYESLGDFLEEKRASDVRIF